MELNALAILSRWLHVISACGLIGSVYFFQVVLPLGTRGLDSAGQEAALLRCRRGFKLTVHVTLLLFLISGTYNAMRAWHVYTQNPGVMHGLFGMHLLLGLGSITILMIALAGREPNRSRMRWIPWALLGLIVAVAVTATLKSAREYAMLHPELSKHVSAKGTTH